MNIENINKDVQKQESRNRDDRKINADFKDSNYCAHCRSAYSISPVLHCTYRYNYVKFTKNSFYYLFEYKN